MNVFKYASYTSVINQKIRDHAATRGYRTQLAQAAGCQLSFLTQALKGRVMLTADQAAGLCVFWRFNTMETDFFLTLLALERSGTPHLRRILEERLQDLRRRRIEIAERLQTPSLREEQQMTLYTSAWYVNAIHILTTIPQFRTVKRMAERLRLSANLVEKAISILQQLGMLKKVGGEWRSQDARLHIPRDSLAATQNHLNWRQISMLKIQERAEDAIHYTAVHSMSRDDYDKLREMILRFIEDSRQIVNPSVEEELVHLAFDLYIV